ncbi:Di-copper centre-containing protein [Delitschia confertaspora ATCC 74209]|uniref:tyrosinase n=1 Tax=Delitschia confertaspora ATCC 74209 TaxID=1513339 RepID=A0A9P4MUJ7_9PLEO|nr:Di-copper centre-containing protein [Delitschia confertaspora ATCC 74209]
MTEPVKGWKDVLATGCKVPEGKSVPPRKELSKLSEEEWYLYVEGLKRFQAEPIDDEHPLSYFQIAGIHGLPYQTWPNMSFNTDGPEKMAESGFCTHNSIRFLTWHRPYLALFESALHAHVKAAAKEIKSPDREKYVAVADTFRMPYWDWARRTEDHFPREALHDKVKTVAPRSEASTRRKDTYNPLHHYPFPSGVPKDITKGYESTVRWPDYPDAEERLEARINTFYNNVDQPERFPSRNLTERVAYILLAYRRFGSMSNNAWRSKDPNDKIKDAENWGSLEGIHNAVHNYTGDTGHMGGIETSAFDPVFWLHHTNIDRLFAIWQALQQDKAEDVTYVTDKLSEENTFALPRGQLEGIDTPLYPFRKTEKEWYTSKTTVRCEEFGYTYPEIVGIDETPTAPQKAGLVRTISEYYAPLPKAILKSKQRKKTAGIEMLPNAHILKEIAEKGLPANAAEMLNLAANLPPTEVLVEESMAKPALRDLAPENKYLEWLVNIKAERHTLDGDYAVHIFLGPVEEEDPFLWPTSPYHVGIFAPLGQAHSTGCSKCQQDQADHTQVTDQIPLTIALVERYFAELIHDLSKDSVTDYLQKNLHWKVLKGGRTVVKDRSAVAGLTVFVVSNEVTLPEDEYQLPIYADTVTVYPEITTKKDSSEGRGEGTGLTENDLSSSGSMEL